MTKKTHSPSTAALSGRKFVAQYSYSFNRRFDVLDQDIRSTSLLALLFKDDHIYLIFPYFLDRVDCTAALTGYLSIWYPSVIGATMESSAGDPQVKRRKVRKGTRSCWECKGRKAKCTYATPEDTICDDCFRRGTKCISQELPEQPLASIDRKRQMSTRMVRVETLIEKLVENVGAGSLVAEHNRGAFQNFEVDKPASASVLVQSTEVNFILPARIPDPYC